VLLSRGADMRRREFLSLVSGAAAWPLAANAQKTALPTVGFLSGVSPKAYAEIVAAFLQGLKESNFIVGENVSVEYRWAEGQYDRLPAMAADLVNRQVAVIVANTPAAPVAKAATRNIPIVFLSSDDPVEIGLVASMNRPGGNVTGVSVISSALGGKQLGVLRQMVPTARSISYLVNPANPNSESNIKSVQQGALAIGLQMNILNARTEPEIDAAFRVHADAFVVAPDSFFIGRSDQLTALAARHAVPTIYPFREFTASGGLLSYGASVPDLYRQVGMYTGRILRGAKPADMPVLQPTKFALVINLKTAKSLGLEIHPQLLATADEVIE
jgi:putative tryptophan/tyrosine transport system substrate-binding protein